jgi:hypothetical protein
MMKGVRCHEIPADRKDCKEQLGHSQAAGRPGQASRNGSALYHIFVNARIDTHHAIRRQMSASDLDSRRRVVSFVRPNADGETKCCLVQCHDAQGWEAEPQLRPGTVPRNTWTEIISAST